MSVFPPTQGDQGAHPLYRALLHTCFIKQIFIQLFLTLRRVHHALCNPPGPTLSSSSTLLTSVQRRGCYGAFVPLLTVHVWRQWGSFTLSCERAFGLFLTIKAFLPSIRHCDRHWAYVISFNPQPYERGFFSSILIWENWSPIMLSHWPESTR